MLNLKIFKIAFNFVSLTNHSQSEDEDIIFSVVVGESVNLVDFSLRQYADSRDTAFRGILVVVDWNETIIVYRSQTPRIPVDRWMFAIFVHFNSISVSHVKTMGG